MVLFVLYAAGIAGLLGYTLLFLPLPILDSNLGFVLNIVQFGFLSLLSFLAYRQEKHFRSVFFQFWILFALIAVSAPVLYHITYWNGPTAASIAYMYETSAVHALFLWAAAKILFTYVFHDEKRWAINLLASLVVLPTCAWLFWPYWWSPRSLWFEPTAVSADTFYNPILHAALVVNILSLLMLMAFFLHKLRTDRPIGVFADTLLFLFGMLYLIDAVEIVSRVKSVELLNMTQWANSVIAVVAIITLLLRLKFKSQTIAHYYESQCLSHNPNVGRRVGIFDRVIIWCFFDPEKVGKRIFLGAGRQAMTVKRTSPRVRAPIAGKTSNLRQDSMTE
ncbi:MAG TPA: hypothetical protein VGL38_11510 [bacterium]